MRRALALLDSPPFLRRMHATGAFAWLVLIVPSWLWWRESVFWVIAISIYANVVGHWSAYQAVRAERGRHEDAELLAAVRELVRAEPRADEGVLRDAGKGEGG